MIEKSTYNADGTLYNKFTYMYDDKGNKIQSNKYSSDGSLSLLFCKITYKYDENGNEIESNLYHSGDILDSKYTYKYDEFDKTGNWTTKISFKDGKPETIIERKIEYY